MKKISIIFAVLAVFMLLASCSNAAGKVDLAGNPINLAGTWSGTLAYKGDTELDLPMSCVEDSSTNGYTDYAGTYTYQDIDALSKDTVSTVTSLGTETTTNYIYNGETTTTTYTVVINADGSSTVTKVEASETKARASITVPTNNVYRVYVNGVLDATYYATQVIPEVLGGTYTTTTTYTRSVPTINETDLVYDTTKSIIYTVSGTLYSGVTPDPSAKTETGVYSDTDCIPAEAFPDLDLEDDFTKTVEPTLKPVEWQNDITETITFTVTNDGLYTLTSVVEVTQAAAAAAEATATNYAAAERKLSTKTTTRTTTGTVAAWETPATDTTPATSTMALSSGVETYSVTATEDFLDKNLNTPTIAKFTGAKEYEIRFFEGKAGRKETAKTRLYVDVSVNPYSGTVDVLDPEGCIVIFDKAVETEKK